jgi:hypothetical protein
VLTQDGTDKSPVAKIRNRSVEDFGARLMSRSRQAFDANFANCNNFMKM